MEHVASLGCLVCGDPATIHHVTSDGRQRIARSHKRVAPLCPRHHQIQWGPKESVEALAHAGFAATYGFDLLTWATDAWDRREEPEHPFWTNGVTRLREIARPALYAMKAGGERPRTNKDARPALVQSPEREASN
jgi:hypothetical protein